MFIFKNNINLLIVLIFISSCSTLNVTQESVSSENIMTIETSGPKDDYINYDSQAVFANATI